ncbi:hypothetical protein PR002_g24292 [Phytophthora rubi]|uniref:RxLR effector protein n=1 Tax=Phytophthora rubi TaxID=129364 RepID=A0A6A3IID7_9STRA|nr:hypothetical protein PR002_g24292 [Phytophthora rubi]
MSAGRQATLLISAALTCKATSPVSLAQAWLSCRNTLKSRYRKVRVPPTTHVFPKGSTKVGSNLRSRDDPLHLVGYKPLCTKVVFGQPKTCTN